MQFSQYVYESYLTFEKLSVNILKKIIEKIFKINKGRSD